MSLDLTARTVLHHYALYAADPAPILHRDGFSGARLWRTDAFCLRAWPELGPTRSQLQTIHALMDKARAAGLNFVPAVLRTRTGASFVEHAGRRWELTTWMPGRADFHEGPTITRLEAACAALAQLHLAWSQVAPTRGSCPAVLRRLSCAREWNDLLASGWKPAFSRGAKDPVAPWAERAWNILRGGVTPLRERLAPWSSVALPLQPCLCDVWHAHVLFEGDVVTGLVDYGSVKTDHVAVDLARLLGSLISDHHEMVRTGLEAYRRIQPLSPEEERLVAILDETGATLAAVNWLRWLYHDGRHFESLTAVAARLGEVVTRLERLTENGV